MTRNPRNDARSCEAIRTPCRKGGRARRPFPSGRGQRPIARGPALSNEATAATGSDLRCETVQIKHDHPMAAAQLHDASPRPREQIDSTGIYGGDYRYKTLWDEFAMRSRPARTICSSPHGSTPSIAFSAASWRPSRLMRERC